MNVRNSPCWLLAYVFALLCTATIIHTQTPYLPVRSCNSHIARDRSGLYTPGIYAPCHDLHGRASFIPEYNHSFSSTRIVDTFFGTTNMTENSCNDTILIQGSLIPNRTPGAWLADYFGLPTDFNGTVAFTPTWVTTLVDLQLRLDYRGDWYVQIDAPIAHMYASLQAQETSSKGNNGYPFGYFNATSPDDGTTFYGAANSTLLPTALDFFSNQQAPQLDATTLFQPLQASRWQQVSHRTAMTGVADATCTLGWNAVATQEYSFGLYLRASAPTGTKPSGTFLWEPIIGSGGYWKLGAGSQLYLLLWQNIADSTAIGFYLEGYAVHLFKTCQIRSFDLCNAANSRYMLAQRLGTHRTAPSLTGASNAGTEFQHEFAPVANLTTSPVAVSIAAEGEFLATCVIRYNQFTCDLGYNFWGHTSEHITPLPACSHTIFSTQKWALKGDAQVIGFDTDSNQPVNLAATQSTATIMSGTNRFSPLDTNRVNTTIDAPKAATTGGLPVDSNPTSATQTNSSNPPVLITTDIINYAGTQGYTNSFFINFGYHGPTSARITPYLGIGGSCEFSMQNPCPKPCGSATTQTVCDSACYRGAAFTHHATLDQWSVWMRLGISFP